LIGGAGNGIYYGSGIPGVDNTGGGGGGTGYTGGNNGGSGVVIVRYRFQA
jgi:hypothetical protein